MAITDNGSRRGGSGTRDRASLCCCHIQSCGSCPPRSNQSSICAVESTWSSYLPFGKGRQLAQVCGRRLFWQIDKPVLDHRSLGVHAHDFARLRLVAGDRVQTLIDQFLDQLGARGLVLDQCHAHLKGLALLAHHPLQLGICACAIHVAGKGSCP